MRSQLRWFHWQCWLLLRRVRASIASQRLASRHGQLVGADQLSCPVQYGAAAVSAAAAYPALAAR